MADTHINWISVIEKLSYRMKLMQDEAKATKQGVIPKTIYLRQNY